MAKEGSQSVIKRWLTVSHHDPLVASYTDSHRLQFHLISPDTLCDGQEDGVNDVGPMISQQVIVRAEILRPDSALIPANEAEKPK